ncbi:MAG TPA: hypothetical protein VKV95_00835 [Terriglobia bacterium]|nr:hypothetical protein [Terriglobia bacterium]
MREEFASLHFLDKVRASASLERLEQRLAPTLLLPLASLLAQSPDPEGALLLLDRYVEAGPPGILNELSSHPAALIYLVAIFGYSESLAEAILADPPLVTQFARDRHFTKLKSIEDLMQDYARFSVTSPDLWLSSQLARFKLRNVLRIALKDVLGLSTLGETTLELATLADVILNHSLAYCDRELEKRYGLPQYRDRQGRIARSGFSILSLGKLGGNELNYSSEIDLIFIYAREGETAGGSESTSVISNKEYYIRLAEAVNRTVTQSTPHGEVYRIDLGKRPDGEQGGLAISVNSALEYYDHRARDWELQMLTKARHSAGDAKVSREFLQGVEPYVYRSNGPARGSAIKLDERENPSEKRSGPLEPGLDVSFRLGGLRDIESLTQSLQRVHGADDFWVRSGGTLLALRKLHDKGHLSDADFAGLTSAYDFFRKVEHRIQLEADHPPQLLPDRREGLNRLARRVSNGISSLSDPGAALLSHLEQTYIAVQEIIRRLNSARPAATGSTDFGLSAPSVMSPDPGHDPYQAAVRSLISLAPELAAIVREASLGTRARNDAARLLSAIMESSEQLRAVRQNPVLLERALDLTAASAYLAQIIIQHPEDLPVLSSLLAEDFNRPPAQMKIGLLESLPNESEAVGRAPGLISARPHLVASFPWAAENGLSMSEKMAMLRAEYRVQTLALGARDCAQIGSMDSSQDRWSRLAARCISSATEIAARSFGESSGLNGSQFGVLAVGRLGRREFDLGSSAELVFVALSPSSEERIESYSRLSERTIEVLSSYTREGDVFPVEAPLQLHGSLVVSEDVLLEYLTESATIDEVIRFADLWPIAGNFEAGLGLAERISAAIFKRFDSYPNLRETLRALLRKMLPEESASTSRDQHPRRAFVEIGPALAALSLRHHRPLDPGTTVLDRIGALHTAGLIDQGETEELSGDANFLHSVDHAVRLATGSASGDVFEAAGQSEEVGNLLRRWGFINSNNTMAMLLPARLHRVHAICLRIAGLDSKAADTLAS